MDCGKRKWFWICDVINVETSTNLEPLGSVEITPLVLGLKTLECNQLGLLVVPLSHCHTFTFMQFPLLKMVFFLCKVML